MTRDEAWRLAMQTPAILGLGQNLPRLVQRVASLLDHLGRHEEYSYEQLQAYVTEMQHDVLTEEWERRRGLGRPATMPSMVTPQYDARPEINNEEPSELFTARLGKSFWELKAMDNGGYQFYYGGHLVAYVKPETSNDAIRKTMLAAWRVRHNSQGNTERMPDEATLRGFIARYACIDPAKDKEIWVLLGQGDELARAVLADLSRKIP